MTIENISDTARWVAVYRGWETDRPDAHFRDPYARILAGERGEEIVRRMPRGRATAWAMIVRTCVIDAMLMKCIGDGTDTVLNLAAGLDARPYRLPLPAELRWVEVDFEPILSYKEEILKNEKPRCRLERVKMDLANQSARQILFEKIGSSSKQVAIITEGLLVYLTADQVKSLGSDMAAHSSFRWWITDLTSPALLKMLQRWYGKRLKEGGVKMQFAPEHGLDFFRQIGWEPLEFRSTFEEARRLNRMMPNAWLWVLIGRLYPKKKREGFRHVGIALLKHS